MTTLPTANTGDYDAHVIKSIVSLQTLDIKTLQRMLEESIKNKYGITKDFSDLVDMSIKDLKNDFPDDFKTVTINYDEERVTQSDDDLELDLLNEDLMCVVCNRMEVGAKNQLLECASCHSLYHQDCHIPAITTPFENWICKNCKETATPSVETQPVSAPVPPMESSKSSHKSSSSSKHSHSSKSSKDSGKYSSKSSYKKSSSSSHHKN